MPKQPSPKPQSTNHHYYLIYKPYGMLSQFTQEQEGQRTLGELYDFPKNVYPVGRLDHESEGLLILTDDKALTDRLLNPKYAHEREYYAQVEGAVEVEAIAALRAGVTLNINGKTHYTLPAKAYVLTAAPDLPERTPPIRERAAIPTAWLSIALTEGKNRQVRRMTAAVGLPTLRLVRVRIGNLYLNNMKSGEVLKIDKKLIYKQLGFIIK
jgi:23S rRNA pseudouridine2457 synthase